MRGSFSRQFISGGIADPTSDNKAYSYDIVRTKCTSPESPLILQVWRVHVATLSVKFWCNLSVDLVSAPNEFYANEYGAERQLVLHILDVLQQRNIIEYTGERGVENLRKFRLITKINVKEGAV